MIDTVCLKTQWTSGLEITNEYQSFYNKGWTNNRGF